MEQDFKVVDGKETAPPNARKVRCFLVIFLLALSIGASFVSLTGTKEGWAKVCKSGLERDQSPYAGAIKYLFLVDPDPSNASPLLVDAIEFQLPPGDTAPFDIKVTEGWLNLETSMWITAGGHVDPHLQVLARIMTAEKYHKKLAEILVDRKSSLVEDYNDDRVVAKIVGGLTAGTLIASAILAIGLLLGFVVSYWQRATPRFSFWIARRANIFMLVSFFVYISEYVVLAVGTHRDLKNNPLVQQGIIPWPDWAWFVAIMGSMCWLGVWTLCRRHDDSLNFRETIASWSVGSKKSWTIASANDVPTGKGTQNGNITAESTGDETGTEGQLNAIP